MQSEIPDVVLPEPILPPAYAFEIGRLAKDMIGELLAAGAQVTNLADTFVELYVPARLWAPIEIFQFHLNGDWNDVERVTLAPEEDPHASGASLTVEFDTRCCICGAAIRFEDAVDGPGEDELCCGPCDLRESKAEAARLRRSIEANLKPAS